MQRIAKVYSWYRGIGLYAVFEYINITRLTRDIPGYMHYTVSLQHLLIAFDAYGWACNSMRGNRSRRVVTGAAASLVQK